ncbi:CPXCG motif-containing cysteine-rich protein [Endozoicomonas sp. OPT23]|uniref:CPXCG motif-containing cysteine-rich protein n=1 Tax=Endozoicomonas sp. OPT23 TaxID=2072845 RepID=UPI00129A4078|nr:CPXCG motif-containing cysteine-rich protein [Endozoicomonas sp. OPT23]MRI35507.1 CPXCG motif-containing cysteine-rich protein [Endozoicomonas sp. OPT23]
MGHSLETTKMHCPNCGELIELLIDCSIESQEYIEDCQVCCRPININVTLDQQEEPQVTLTSQDE